MSEQALHEHAAARRQRVARLLNERGIETVVIVIPAHDGEPEREQVLTAAEYAARVAGAERGEPE